MPLTKMSPVQEKELAVLKEVIKVIEKNNLHYCAIGGTCLGAVRHNGFIPWDDDLDIAMPRKDYEVLRNNLTGQFPDHIKKLDYDTSESNTLLFTKFHDIRTTMIEKFNLDHAIPEMFSGVWVDVFPLDGIPDNPVVRRIWYFLYLFLDLSNSRRRFPKQKITGSRELIKEGYGWFLKLLFPYDFFTNALELLVSRYDISKCKTATYNAFPREKKYVFEILVKSCFFTDTIQVPFEDTMIRIPRRYSEYLTLVYGDYMKFPTEDKRNSGHTIAIADMERPVDYYVKTVFKESSL